MRYIITLVNADMDRVIVHECDGNLNDVRAFITAWREMHGPQEFDVYVKCWY